MAELAVPVSGWKVAALPDGEVIFAPILESRLFKSPASLPPSVYGLGGVECEVAFRFAREPVSCNGKFSREDIVEVIEGALVAIEVVNSRWTSAFSTPRNAMIADLLSNGGLVVGPVNANWRDIPFDMLSAKLNVNGNTACQTEGGNPQKDLIGLLTSLANELINQGIVLAAGTIVTTGSYTGFATAKPGDHLRADIQFFEQASAIFEQFNTKRDTYALR
ncbi:fumarylacetoacetate hydrolase family protein [Ensifer aridi]|uniref:fumarylacetoacetate hydrolase family protein n=1 Tax=Ensifer aridi TaxID=1708715 RepID=UPI00143160C1|nr:fumarylacetoacetate hydrolase family protein [Ensifer aridi]